MKKRVYEGIAASGGKALGVIFENKKPSDEVDDSLGHSSEERGRFYRAINAAKAELISLAEEAKGAIGEKESEIFLIHSLFLEDEDFLAAAERALAATHTAEYALIVARDFGTAALRATGDGMMMARCDDLCDVASRVMAHLRGGGEKKLPEEAFLYLSRDIMPSDLVHLSESECVGIVLSEGSLQSHAAILANALSLPMLIGVGEVATALGERGLLDCDGGSLMLSPDDEAERSFFLWQKGRKMRERELSRYRDAIYHYPSGRRLTVAANIGSFAECERALSVGAEGIGLFRSEFLFMERERMPSEEEQFSLYREIIKAVSPHFAVIRVLDVGADKIPKWMDLPKEQNPVLGLRGIRLLDDYPELFRAQFRALLRASAEGELVILLPMIVAKSEVLRVKKELATLADTLVSEGYSVGKYKLGVMIETPSAALIADELAEVSEYFSIGSNDLYQYTMAIDRENPRTALYAERHPPALLKLIAHTVEVAHQKGIKASLCGALAGDLTLTRWLLDTEIDVLSLSPSAILPIREKVAEYLKNEP